jgi:hypothetical protein
MKREKQVVGTRLDKERTTNNRFSFHDDDGDLQYSPVLVFNFRQRQNKLNSYNINS